MSSKHTSFDNVPLALSVREMAEVLGIGLPAAYDLCHIEGFPAIRVSSRRIIVPKEALQRWLNERAGIGG